MMMRINRTLRRARTEEAGFTLIELLVVVIILGILAAIIVPKFATTIKNAQDGADAADFKLVQDAVDRYCMEHGGDPLNTTTHDNLEKLLVTDNNYLESLPDKYSLDADGKVIPVPIP